MLRFGIAGLALAAGVIAAAAQDMKSPRIAPAHVDWDAVAVELDALDVPKPVVVPEVMAKLNGVVFVSLCQRDQQRWSGCVRQVSRSSPYPPTMSGLVPTL